MFRNRWVFFAIVKPLSPDRHRHAQQWWRRSNYILTTFFNDNRKTSQKPSDALYNDFKANFPQVNHFSQVAGTTTTSEHDGFVLASCLDASLDRRYVTMRPPPLPHAIHMIGRALNLEDK